MNLTQVTEGLIHGLHIPVIGSNLPFEVFDDSDIVSGRVKQMQR